MITVGPKTASGSWGTRGMLLLLSLDRHGLRPALQQDAYRDEYGSPVRSIQVGALTEQADALERVLRAEVYPRFPRQDSHLQV